MNTLAYRRQEARKCLVMGYMLEPDRRYNSVTWWDRATPRDAMTYFHSTSNGEPYFISATRSLAIASRYIKYPRNDYKYRYVYVFVAPQDRVVSTWETMRHMQSYKDNQEEVEYSMLHDATPYIKAVYDTEIGQFLRDDTR